jgi:mannose-1-phosphate guanylyltransferase/mannose-6-phosphate isomerase
VNGTNTIELKKNQSTYIPKKTVHRLSNICQENLEIIEIQTGEKLIEEDIIRYEDDYGRK